MLSDDEIETYFSKHKLTQPAREYINLARQSPSRVVGRHARRNVTTAYVSKKLGLSIQTESRTAEKIYVLELEYSRSVLEYWDQPPPVTISRTFKNDSQRSGSYTPDFVILTTDGPSVIEVKTEEQLQELMCDKPRDWYRAGDDDVIYRPAQETFTALGLVFQVVSTAQLNQIRSTNLDLLMRSRNELDTVTPNIRSAVERALSRESWMTLDALQTHLETPDVTPIVQMIDRGQLHALLDTELLSLTESACVALSASLLALRQQLRDADPHFQQSQSGPSVVRVEWVPGQKQAERLVKNLERLRSGEQSRSTRRWRQKIKNAEANEAEAIHVLLPQTHRSGNRRPRLHPVCIDFVATFLAERYASPTRLSPYKAYLVYKASAAAAHPHLSPVSRPTFNKIMRAQNQRVLAQDRGGRRAANAADEPSQVETRYLLPTRPFEAAAVDHYHADIHCPLANGHTTFTGRAWITVLVDTFSWCVLAVWISFQAPSRRACAMVIRRCVRQHGRLPESIVVDHGSEFESVYFSSLLVHCSVNLSERPPGHPRYGAHAERFFGLFKTQWLSHRPGNIVQYKEARSVSGTHAPQKQAIITIENLLSELTEFVSWHNANVVGPQEAPPLELVKRGLERFPFSGCKVINDERFRIASAVDSTDYTIDPVRGVHVGDSHFWHPALAKANVKKSTVEIRPDPEDPYRVFAKIDHAWVTCLASGSQISLLRDPVAQLANAIRLLDGKEARKQAKDAADQRLIAHVRNFDAQYEQSANLVHPPQPTPQQQVSSIFADLRDADLAPLVSQSWGDKS